MASKTFKCMVCGKKVDPSVDTVLTVGDAKLFPVHTDKCLQVAKGTVLAGRDLLEARVPMVKGIRKALGAFFSAMNGDDE